MAPEGPRFLAVDPARYFPDYAPALPPAVCADLELDDPAQARLYCLVTVPAEGPAAATANLRAPLVVNPANWRSTQVVLLDGSHPIRRPLRRYLNRRTRVRHPRPARGTDPPTSHGRPPTHPWRGSSCSL